MVIKLKAQITKIVDLEQTVEKLQKDKKSDLSVFYEKLYHNTSKYSKEIFLKYRIIKELENLLFKNKQKKTYRKRKKKGGKK